MEECSFFSIAIDSTLIRNEHLYSCFARFSFEDSIKQTPLFFVICHRSTANDLANFVSNKLIEHDCVFEMLVSVSTDGASNMIGRSNGMTSALKRIIHRHCAEQHLPFNDFHSVWCLAHRLNLVTKDLLSLKRLNVVKAFSDWFSDRRRQASYKKFLSQHNDGQKLKTIPQPSNTQWLFYRDVVASILSQDLSVDGFIQDNDDFQKFWNSLVEDDEGFHLSADKHFSLLDGEFHCLFMFARSVLEILGRVNTVFQERYLLIWEAWCVVNSLKKHILWMMSHIQTTFTFLSNLDQHIISECESYLQNLLHSLSLRFPCPSLSHEMRGMRSSFEVLFDEDSIMHNPFDLNCSLSQSFDLLATHPTINDTVIATAEQTSPELNMEI